MKINRIKERSEQTENYTGKELIICKCTNEEFVEIYSNVNTDKILKKIINIFNNKDDYNISSKCTTLYIIHRNKNIPDDIKSLNNDICNSYISIREDYTPLNISFLLYLINTKKITEETLNLLYCVKYYNYINYPDTNNTVKDLIDRTFFNNETQKIFDSFTLPLLPKKYLNLEKKGYTTSKKLTFTVIEKQKNKYKSIIESTYCRELLYSRLINAYSKESINISNLKLLLTYSTKDKNISKFHKFQLFRTKLLLNKIEKMCGMKKTTIKTIKYEEDISWLFSFDEDWLCSPITLSIFTAILRDLNVPNLDFNIKEVNHTHRVKFLIKNKKEILCIIKNRKKIFFKGAKYYLELDVPFDENGIETFLKNKIYTEEYIIYKKLLRKEK